MLLEIGNGVEQSKQVPPGVQTWGVGAGGWSGVRCGGVVGGKGLGAGNFWDVGHCIELVKAGAIGGAGLRGRGGWVV